MLIDGTVRQWGHGELEIREKISKKLCNQTNLPPRPDSEMTSLRPKKRNCSFPVTVQRKIG